MNGFSMGVITTYTMEAVMSLSLESHDEEKKKTLASVLWYKDTTKRLNPQVEHTLKSLLVEETLRTAVSI